MGQGGGKELAPDSRADAALRTVLRVLAAECDGMEDAHARQQKRGLASRTVCMAVRHLHAKVAWEDVITVCRRAAANTTLEPCLRKLVPKRLKGCRLVNPREVDMVRVWLAAASSDNNSIIDADTHSHAPSNRESLVAFLREAGIVTSTERLDAVVEACGLRLDGEGSGFGGGGSCVVSFVAFRRVWCALEGHAEYETLFAKYAEGLLMSEVELREFLVEEQGEPAELARMIIDRHGVEDGGIRGLGLPHFVAYLTSTRDNGLFSKLRASRVTDDMSQPLFSYFISSSHNTYLARGQLVGPSSVDMYKHALMWGCRCVELDCWDGANGEPVVYHGYTKTTKVLFRDVVRTIERYAFTQSSYPVILSLEVHAGLAQQQVMARCLVDVLGDRIYAPQQRQHHPRQQQQLNPLDILASSAGPGSAGGASGYPSPDALRGRFIIKGKRGAVVQGGGGDACELCSTDGDEKHPDIERERASVEAHGRVASGSRGDGLQRTRSWLASKMKVHEDLCRLIGLPGAKDLLDPQVDVAQAVRRGGEGYKIIAISEGRLESIVQTMPHLLAERAKCIIARVYPAGTRISSSNYHPQAAWNVGAQVVAMNFQNTQSAKVDPLRLYLGRFRANGGCGYILKPPPLRDPNIAWSDYSACAPASLRLTVLRIVPPAGQACGKAPRKGFTLKLAVSGIPADTIKVEGECVGIRGGAGPASGSALFTKTLHFRSVDMATVVLQCWTPAGTMLGEAVLPASCIARGHRVLPLWSSTMRPADTTLWVHAAWVHSGPQSDAALLGAHTGARHRPRRERAGGGAAATTAPPPAVTPAYKAPPGTARPPAVAPPRTSPIAACRPVHSSPAGDAPPHSAPWPGASMPWRRGAPRADTSRYVFPLPASRMLLGEKTLVTQADGTACPGRVVAMAERGAEGEYTVQFADDTRVTRLPLAVLVPVPPTAAAQASTYDVFERVVAAWVDGGEVAWYGAVVTHIDDDGSCAVQWDDGSGWNVLPPTLLRRVHGAVLG